MTSSCVGMIVITTIHCLQAEETQRDKDNLNIPLPEAQAYTWPVTKRKQCVTACFSKALDTALTAYVLFFPSSVIHICLTVLPPLPVLSKKTSVMFVRVNFSPVMDSPRKTTNDPVSISTSSLSFYYLTAAVHLSGKK